MNEAWGGANSIGNKIPAGKYTRKQAAAKVGRSPDRLRQWHKDGVYKASDSMMFGKTKVWLYTDKDIANMLDLVSTRRPGIKPKAS